MKGQKRIRDYNIVVGSFQTGKRNAITDVEGVRVGHVTLDNKEVKTGVTVILPHSRNLFKEKLFAAAHVINGFGKSMGTIQIQELGTIETPIALTNTLSIGEVSSALIDYMLETNEDIGKTTGTVNPVVCECNDGFLNDIRGNENIRRTSVLVAVPLICAEPAAWDRRWRVETAIKNTARMIVTTTRLTSVVKTITAAPAARAIWIGRWMRFQTSSGRATLHGMTGPIPIPRSRAKEMGTARRL